MLFEPPMVLAPAFTVPAAVLLNVFALYYFFTASVLELEAGDRTYQFGFNPWAHPEKHFPMSVEEREEKLQHSAFSIVVRVFVVAYLAYIIWDLVA